MRRRRFILAGIIIFIGVNYLLLSLDKEHKVDRLAYVSEWLPAFQTDMKEEVNKPGVLAPIQENHLYFSEETGEFQEFLMEEGAEVQVGDPLYTYRVTNYYETIAALEQQQRKLNGEVQAVEGAISEMNHYQIPRSTQGTANADTEQPTIQIELPENPVEAAMMKDQYLIEKKKELAAKEAELSSIEAQLNELESTGDSITVESPYEGLVTEVSAALEAPLVTIAGKQLQAEGELTEQERSRIAEGLPVHIQVDEMAMALQGTLEKIQKTPENVSIEGKSIYPFSVAIEEDEDKEAEQQESQENKVEQEEAGEESNDTTEELLPGYHVNLSIITDESKDATVLFEKNLHAGAVWKMNANGKLMKQKVETGLYMASMVEITKGFKAGEWAAAERKSQFRHQAIFITPLQWYKFKFKEVVSGKYDQWGKFFITGLLSR
ncbi:efflux RND transporter periplasmic adaptor subunit [Virgibacillus halodenitrificans]|uniref:efflux RND transporter periplasmic adaptor subunit n=1 Tax=Virgibacillus halodenitrificans TaxID=1482 RepID=UPI001F1E68F3|nr:HlyD family efflux transporter periplasmic adaptor subunit [Virgibacillus halodenitrificans]MCG1027057.1 efflux RND transporter periplasmic adaptor subunit [Virgibacillus halodenitrificans]